MTEETMGDVVEQLGRAIHALNPALMPVLMDTSESAKFNSDYERVTLLFSKLRHLSRPAPSEPSGDVVEAHHCKTCGFSGRLPNNLSHHKNPKTGAYCFGLITRSTTPAPQADALREAGRMEIASARKTQAILVLDGASVGSANYETALQIRDLWNANLSGRQLNEE